MATDTSKLPRISPYRITDDLIRASLYRDIRATAATKPKDWMEWEISIAEVLSPELVAYRVYSTHALKWLVAISAGLDDWREALPEGGTVWLPPLAWVRDRIRLYGGEGA